jgi:hypothetical protein
MVYFEVPKPLRKVSFCLNHVFSAQQLIYYQPGAFPFVSHITCPETRKHGHQQFLSLGLGSRPLLGKLDGN